MGSSEDKVPTTKSSAKTDQNDNKMAGCVIMILGGIILGMTIQLCITKMGQGEIKTDETAKALAHWIETTPEPELLVFMQKAQNLARDEQVMLAEKALSYGHVNIFDWLYKRYYQRNKMFMTINLDAILKASLFRGDKKTCQLILTRGGSGQSLCGFVVERAFPDAQHADLAAWLRERCSP